LIDILCQALPNIQLSSPDKPVEKDSFEGQSQERLAHSVCNYVRRIDAKTAMEGQAENTMPRIIGLEGGWRSGILE